MVKKMISGFLALLLILCAFSPAAYADDEHQHTFGEVTDTVDTKGLKLPNGQDFPVNVSITKSPCSTPGISCGKVLYSWNFGGRGGSFVDDKDLPVAEVIKRWYEWNERFYGNNVGFTQFQAGGGSASPGGVGRNPSGYAGEGVPNISCSGKLHFSVSPSILFIRRSLPTGHLNVFTDNNFKANDDNYGTKTYVFCDNNVIKSKQVSDVLGDNKGYFCVCWKIQAPCDGTYFFDSEPFKNLGSWSYYSDKLYTGNIVINNPNYFDNWNKYLNKGENLYLFYTPLNLSQYPSSMDYFSHKANNLILCCEPLSNVVNQTNITINNNTWNGNIYIDNSNKLTYIYPQYTTINENNETVTNISNNPIIYNQETKQYYTYDQTTNNYYYITYGDPVPTPTPSPSPDPGGSGGGSSGGDGSGGGSGDTPSGGGSSWWEKLLDKLGSALIDGLLDAIKGILKLLFDLFSSILGWIIWLCSKVFDLFPFLPPGVGALLVGGVVVCFVLAFIKFIRG